MSSCRQPEPNPRPVPPYTTCTPCTPCAPARTYSQFARPGAPYENDGDPMTGGKRGVVDYVKSLEFPPDSPWRSNRG